jgi:hypothetical protein
MWIKNGNALYNSDYISKIEVVRTTIKATFEDGSSETIGLFKTTKEANDIFTSITKSMLFDTPDHPGIIIKNTKKETKKT